MALDLSKYLPSSSAPRYDISSANVSQIMSGQVSPTRENILSGAYKVTSAPSYDPSLVKNIPKSTNYSSTPVAQPKKSIMQNVWEGLALPSQISEKLITGGKGYEQYFKEKGLTNEDAIGALSFTSRMVVDPLNLIPVAKIPKVAGLISKVPGASKVAGAVNKTKSIVRTGASKVNTIPAVNKTTDFFGERFIKNWGSPNVRFAKEAYRQGTKKFAQMSEASYDRIKTAVGGLKKRTDFENLGKALDMPKSQAIKLMGAENYARIEKYIAPMREILKDEIDDLARRGIITPKIAANWKKRNYFPHYKEVERSSAIGGSTAIKEKRLYLSKRTKKSLDGMNWNAPQGVLRREVRQIKDNIIQDTLRLIRDKTGIKVPKGRGKKIPEGYTYVNDATGGFKELNGYAIPNDVYKFIKGTVAGQKNVFHRGLDRITQEWKPIVTAVNPAFHVTNIMGNVSNMVLGGTKSLKRLAQASTPQWLARKVGLGFTPAEEALFKKVGIGGKGWLGGDFIDNAFDESLYSKIFGGYAAKLSVKDGLKDGYRAYKGLTEGTRKAGAAMEDNARKAFFLDNYHKALKAGQSNNQAIATAAKSLDTYLFDYLTGLTDFERKYMRSIFPFYTWSRFNLPLQFRELAKQPHKYAFVSKLEREMNDGQQKDPGEFGDNIAFPTPFKDSQGRQIKLRPMLPMQDLFNNDLNKIGNMANPFAKEVSSLGTYGFLGGDTLTDNFTGQEVTNKNLPLKVQLEDILKNRVLSLFRPARSASKVLEDPSPMNILRTLIGNTTVYDPEQGKMSEIYDSQGREAALEKRYFKIINSSMSPEEKKRKIQELKN